MRFSAIYNDQTSFSWDEDTANENAYPKIDRAKLLAFEVHDPKRALESPPRQILIHRLHLEPGQRLIVRRRVMQGIMSDAIKWIYLVGYQEIIAGQNRQAITVIFQDGHTELIGSWKDVPFHSPKLMEAERGH